MRRIVLGILLLAVVVGALGLLLYRWYSGSSNSGLYIRDWLSNPTDNPEYAHSAHFRCPGAPFILPSEGFIGLLWRDDAGPYNPLNRHTGIDIFGGGSAGTVPIFAVYDGYLTRLDEWRSTVIIRHDDPLQAGRTIWTYYTHMANRDGRSFISEAFPPGTYGQPVQQGDFLGYQGDYSPAFPVAVHLHISIVTSEENGSFKNEAVLENTLNPSPYFGMELNADSSTVRPVQCIEQP